MTSLAKNQCVSILEVRKGLTVNAGSMILAKFARAMMLMMFDAPSETAQWSQRVPQVTKKPWKALMVAAPFIDALKVSGMIANPSSHATLLFVCQSKSYDTHN